jgi:hypothetical protein
MADIKDQLIKDSYNYVLQSDLGTGVVYRIGGDIPVNPIFQSGLTINSGFTYSNGTEQLGYVMTCDAFGNATWEPISAATPSSGVTSVTAGSGLSGNVTTGAVTIVNTAPDRTVTISGGTGITTGGTYPNFTIVNSAPDRTVTITGGTNIEITGSYPDFGVNYTGLTTIQGITGITGTSGVSASTTDYLTTIINTAPDQTVTISGGTGITTGGTYPNFTIVNSAPDRTVTITGGTNIQITGTYPDFGVNFTGATTGGTVSGDYLPLSGGTVTGATQFTGGLTADTISATTYFNLPVSGLTSGVGIGVSNSNGNYTISYTGSSSGSFTGGTVTGPTIFTNGLTANTISATTYYNLPKDIFVTGGTYNNGDVTFTNNSGGTFTVTGFAVGGGGGQTFYLNLSQSQGGNRLLSTTGSTASEQTSGVTISNGVTSTIASFQSQPLNITLLPGGIWSFYLHSYKENNNATFNIFVELYKRTSGGTQTLLFTTDPAPVTTNSPNPSMQLSDGYFSGTPLSVSDSIVAVVRATNTSNQSHIITLVTEGSQHYSYAVSTIPTQQGLTCDTLSGCSIIQTIQTDVSNKLDKSGGTIAGDLIINSGLTANTISATIYQNLPGSSSANCFTDFFVTNISGCSPVNMLSPLNVQDGLSVTGTSTFTSQVNFTGGLSANTFSAETYQNLPSFNSVQINGTTQFSGDTNNFINFSGINITITSAATNTLVFSAATGGSGAVSSVTAGSGLSGNSTTGDITLSVTGVTASQINNSTTVGQNLITGITNPSEIRYIRINSDNSVSTLTATQLLSDLGLAPIVLSNDVSITASTTTLNDVTGLSFPIVSGNKYKFRAELYVTTTVSNTGSKFAVNANVAVSAIVYRATGAGGTAAANFVHNAFALDSASATNVGAVLSSQYVVIEGILIANNTGTAIIRFGKGSANAGTLTVRAGSFLNYQII